MIGCVSRCACAAIRWQRNGLRAGLALALAATAMVLPASESEAGWFTRTLREAGEAGGAAGRQVAGGLDNVGQYVAKLPKIKGEAALAARREASGHWRFTNAKGETFTAATPAEMARVGRVLAPAVAAGEARLTLIVPDDVVFAAGKGLDALPDARLRVLVDKKSYPLRRQRGNGGALDVPAAEVRNNVIVPMRTPELFREAVFQLERSFEPGRVRIFSLADEAGTALSAAPRRDPSTKRVLPDRIAPSAIADTFGRIPGQTAVLTGRVDGSSLVYRTASGAEKSIELAPLKRAAAAADVDLLILNSKTPRQPGSRNWLWLRAEVDGLDTALTRKRFADFLAVMADSQGSLAVTVNRSADGRVRLSATPLAAPDSGGVVDTLGTFVAEVASEAAGRVLTSGLEADLVDRDRASELKLRIIPGVPSALQLGYIASLIVGLFGLPVARGWWFAIWPPEVRAEYSNAIGYQVARFLRLLGFLAAFLPIVGIPAGLVHLASTIWGWITLPIRLARWVFGLFRSRPA